jgi:hypothetical protein
MIFPLQSLLEMRRTRKRVVHDEHDSLRQGYGGPPKLHAKADGTMLTMTDTQGIHRGHRGVAVGPCSAQLRN